MLRLRYWLWPLLYVLSLVYGLGIWLWRITQVRKSKQHYACGLLAVGNLAVGGTGKTPHVLYLLEWLQKNRPKSRLGMLSRGYGRKTKGYLEASIDHTATELGDEPYQVFRTMAKQVRVFVSENRHVALAKHESDLDWVVLDDAYQQLSLQPRLNILLSDFQKPFYEDKLLPLGRLREQALQAKRADCLIITKCPNDLSELQQEHLKSQSIPYLKPNTAIFFSHIVYAPYRPLNELAKTFTAKSFWLLSGIAQYQGFEQHARSQLHVLGCKHLSDHVFYTQELILSIKKEFLASSQSHTAILTTEKDAVKLLSEPLASLLADIPVFFWPISVSFGQDTEAFHDFLDKKLK
ncbi:MAG: tetraacyldisaccharide 4'-kinase [Cytophagales bacterium]|nr:MAG: tetraacyldisaccharide 4'-kinase [Cytophagales bacterium]TAF61357.1 MAG: tetraacyldisaccharide 4'-kinase [Cytophagales bacterium]